MSEANDNFNLKAFDNMGFPEELFVAYRQARQQGNPDELKLGSARKPLGENAAIFIEPIIEKKKNSDDFYLIQGWKGTLVEGEKVTSSVFKTFQLRGYTVDQGIALLRGQTVRVSKGKSDGVQRFNYEKLDFTKKDDLGAYELIKRRDNGSLIAALSQAQINGNNEQKSDLYLRLQKGQRVEVSIRTPEGNRNVAIEASLRESGQGIDMYDQTGKLLKQYPESNVQLVSKVPEDNVFRQSKPAVTGGSDQTLKDDKVKGLEKQDGGKKNQGNADNKKQGNRSPSNKRQPGMRA